MSTYKYFQGILFGGIILLLVSCVQFKTATLYQGTEPAEQVAKPVKISEKVEPIIYRDATTDSWGLEKDVCQDAMTVSDPVYAGSTALKLSWNRSNEGCKWAGIGFGWDDWVGKDLSELHQYAAVQMYVRSQKGKMFGLPIVLTLEDYSGGMGFAYTGNKYFERTFIDENWQKVLVPLLDFEIEKENLDLTNIKQLQLEFQNSADIFLDEVELVLYTPEPQESWVVETKRPDPVTTPITLFDDQFINNNGWGLISDKCQNFKTSNKRKSSGSKSLHASWNTSNQDCALTSFGVSWNKWFPVNMTSVRETMAIEFALSGFETLSPVNTVKVGFEDYERGKSFAQVGKEHITQGNFKNNWNRITIPLSDIPNTIDFSNIKQLIFQFDGDGEVFIDEIKFVSNSLN